MLKDLIDFLKKKVRSNNKEVNFIFCSTNIWTY